MKRLIVLLAAALCAAPAFAKPDEPPGAKGYPPPHVMQSLPKPPGADKPLASVQGGLGARGQSGRSVPAEQLKFNPPKR